MSDAVGNAESVFECICCQRPTLHKALHEVDKYKFDPAVKVTKGDGGDYSYEYLPQVKALLSQTPVGYGGHQIR